MSNIVARSNWGARAPKHISKGTLSKRSTGHWNGPQVRVYGKTSWGHEKCASLVRGIQNFHMDSRGWSDIAYNFVVCPHGIIFEGRGLNVRNGANGTNDGNKTSHAIMWLSGEGNPFTEDEKNGFVDAVEYVHIHTSAPNSAIGHRDHKSTECPGDERYSWIHNGMPISKPSASGAIFKLGSSGPGVGLLKVSLNILHKERINAAGTGHGRIISIEDGAPYFNSETQEAVREIQRFLVVMWKLAGSKGQEPKVNGVVDEQTLGGIAFWVNEVLKKSK